MIARQLPTAFSCLSLLANLRHSRSGLPRGAPWDPCACQGHLMELVCELLHWRRRSLRRFGLNGRLAACSVMKLTDCPGAEDAEEQRRGDEHYRSDIHGDDEQQQRGGEEQCRADRT